MFTPERVRLFGPAWISTPLPEITWPSVMSVVRFTFSDALLTMLPEPMVPVAPPSPICKVPPVMVVIPV